MTTLPASGVMPDTELREGEVGVMPKVKINSAQVYPVPATPGVQDDAPTTDGRHDRVDPELYLRWRNCPEGGGHVQFVAEVDTDHLEDLITEASSGERKPARIEVWFPVVNRREINLAVRTLRTARDKALGADA